MLIVLHLKKNWEKLAALYVYTLWLSTCFVSFSKSFVWFVRGTLSVPWLQTHGTTVAHKFYQNILSVHRLGEAIKSAAPCLHRAEALDNSELSVEAVKFMSPLHPGGVTLSAGHRTSPPYSLLHVCLFHQVLMTENNHPQVLPNKTWHDIKRKTQKPPWLQVHSFSDSCELLFSCNSTRASMLTSK